MPTFETTEAVCFAEKREIWRSHGPVNGWRHCADRYVLAKLGAMSVDKVGSAAVYEVLRPIAPAGSVPGQIASPWLENHVAIRRRGRKQAQCSKTERAQKLIPYAVLRNSRGAGGADASTGEDAQSQVRRQLGRLITRLWALTSTSTRVDCSAHSVARSVRTRMHPAAG